MGMGLENLKCIYTPLYNIVRYKTVWDVTLITVGRQLDYFAVCLYISLLL